MNGIRVVHTGTFFCEMTTAQSLPRTPTDMMFAAVMALNAYSNHRSDQKAGWRLGDAGKLFRSEEEGGGRTNLI